MNERWQEIERIYHRALELDGSARAEFLAKTCAGNAGLRDEVESLLAHGDQAGSYLETPPAEMAAKAFGKGERSPAASTSVLELGTMIAHYRVTARLGAGGMGEVFRARDTKLQRDVALKILPQAMARDAERMARFEREAQVLASLNHPNIAAIYGLEESNGIRALVMELVEGETLGEKIVGEGSALPRERGALPCQEALPIARQIAEALEYAHERGVMHRDLKPANVKITPEGAVKVLDFGLAKAVAPGFSPAHPDAAEDPTDISLATRPGMILGTAAYMSPEQAKGQRADRRCDIWAFGCVLYEMLSGRKAFEGETLSDVLAAVITKEPEWNALPTIAPLSIQKLLRRCLQKDVRQRLQAIGDARIAIEETLSGTGVPPVESHGQDAHATRPLRRLLPRLLAGLAICVLVLAFVIWKFAPRAALRAPMHFSSVTNFAGVQSEPALSPDGRSVAFVSNRDGPYEIYVGLVSGGNVVKLTDDPNFKARPCWSPDGSQIAYSRLSPSGIWDIWMVPALGGTPRRLILTAKDPAWSPDGRTLAYENSVTGALWISDISGQNARLIKPTAEPRLRFTEPRFSPDGRELAFIETKSGPYGGLDAVDLASGKLRQLDYTGLALSPAWSPDGKFIYFTSNRSGTMNVWKISAAGGEPEQITAGQGDDAQLDVSADGKRIVFSTFRERAYVAELDLASTPGQQTQKPLTTDSAREQRGAVYSPDGKHLAYFSDLKGVEKGGIWLADADGSNPVNLVHESGEINIFPRWTPDGQWLVYLNGAPRASEIRRISISGGIPQTLVKDEQPIDLSFDVGPDGRLIYLTPKSQVVTFDPGNGKTQRLETLPAGWKCEHLRWSPEGREVGFIVLSSTENDPNAGLWVSDFKNPPRQVFHGWAAWYARAPNNEIYVLERKPDLSGVLWKVGWDGKGLTRIPTSVPLPRLSYWVQPAQNPQDFFDVSPDGRHLAWSAQAVLQANIGMIENVR